MTERVVFVFVLALASCCALAVVIGSVWSWLGHRRAQRQARQWAEEFRNR